MNVPFSPRYSPTLTDTRILQHMRMHPALAHLVRARDTPKLQNMRMHPALAQLVNRELLDEQLAKAMLSQAKNPRVPRPAKRQRSPSPTRASRSPSTPSAKKSSKDSPKKSSKTSQGSAKKKPPKKSSKDSHGMGGAPHRTAGRAPKPRTSHQLGLGHRI